MKLSKAVTSKFAIAAYERAREAFTETHKGKYDYSKAIYTTQSTKIVVICSTHREFSVSVSDHKKRGCPSCSKERQKKERDAKGYPLRMLKDLGRVKATKNSKQLRRHALWECPDCKEAFSSNVNSVKRGLVGRCTKCRGKATGDRCRTHGYGNGDRLFRIWSGILGRCQGSERVCSKNYKHKGVTICAEWEKDFMRFRNWALANRYDDTLVIDKDLICEIENIHPKVYSESTCLWVTRSDNAKFRHKNIEWKKLYLTNLGEAVAK